jgi:hypothetical protein
MTDFLGHLVDAPLANILIIAGLLFLGIGAVGKVTGKIEPDKMGRMMASLLGLVLMTVGLVVHVKGDFSNKSQTTSSVPIIRVFSVTPAQVTKGGNVTISWDVLNADDVELDPFGQVPSTGDRVVQPQLTTNYRLNATGKDGGKIGTFQQVIVRPRIISTGTSGLSGSKPQPPVDDASDPVYALKPPPPLRDESQPRDPGDNSRWTPGSWYYDSGQSDYYWVPGVWVTPPHGELWTPPYWQYDSGRYQWHHGYWGPHVGFYGGINYGFGYFGRGYHSSPIKSGNRLSYNGGPGRIPRKPTPEELAANRDKHIGALRAQLQMAQDATENPTRFPKDIRPQTVPPLRRVRKTQVIRRI